MVFAVGYAGLCCCVIAFQIALIAGAPWGRITQGGRVDGALAPAGRTAAAVSIPIVAFKALAILSAVGLGPIWPDWTAWAALAIQAVVMVLNLITPSRRERMLWGPITTGMFVLAATVVLTA